MSKGFPYCKSCANRGDTDVCDGEDGNDPCQDGDLYEEAEQDRISRPLKRSNAREVFEVIAMGRSNIQMVDTRERLVGMQSDDLVLYSSPDRSGK